MRPSWQFYGLLTLLTWCRLGSACSSGNGGSNTRRPFIENGRQFMKLKQGKLEGIRRSVTTTKNVQSAPEEEYVAFYGIPYAKPPIGDLRWKRSEEAKGWGGTLDATDGDAVKGCPQTKTLGSPKVISEDCLYLNVFIPNPEVIENSSLKKRPIMFWIHGGSFVHGAGSLAGYNGGQLATEHGVVVVTINYRLGSFGFLYDDHDANSIVGNQGIWDMIRALEWTRKNADTFYGDKDKITIFGESAGGQAVTTLLSLKTNNNYYNLFKQAIAQSPPVGLPYRNKDQATTEADVLLDKLGCTNWGCARNQKWETILEAQQQVRGLIDFNTLSSLFEAWTPTLEDVLLDMHPLEALQKGRSSDKKVAIGHTTGEGDIFVYSAGGPPLGKREYELLMRNLFGDDSKTVLKKYPSPCKDFDPSCDASSALAKVASSYIFDCPIRKTLVERSRKTVPTYKYLFGQPVYKIDGLTKRAKEACSKVACHAADVPYTFGTFATQGLKIDDSEEDLLLRMQTYWSNFALTGDPNKFEDRIKYFGSNPEISCWNRYSNSETNDCNDGSREPFFTQELVAEGKNQNIDVKKVDQACDFWDELDAYLQH